MSEICADAAPRPCYAIRDDQESNLVTSRFGVPRVTISPHPLPARKDSGLRTIEETAGHVNGVRTETGREKRCWRAWEQASRKDRPRIPIG